MGTESCRSHYLSLDLTFLFCKMQGLDPIAGRTSNLHLKHLGVCFVKNADSWHTHRNSTSGLGWVRKMEPDKWPGDPIPPDFSSNGHILSRLLTPSFGTHAVVGGIPGPGPPSHTCTALKGLTPWEEGDRQGDRKLSGKGTTVLGYRWGHDIYQHRVPGEPIQTEEDREVRQVC